MFDVLQTLIIISQANALNIFILLQPSTFSLSPARLNANAFLRLFGALLKPVYAMDACHFRLILRHLFFVKFHIPELSLYLLMIEFGIKTCMLLFLRNT